MKIDNQLKQKSKNIKNIKKQNQKIVEKKYLLILRINEKIRKK